MSIVEKKVQFYKWLIDFIRPLTLYSGLIDQILGLYQEIKTELCFEEFSKQFLLEAREEYHDRNSDLETVESLAEAAFEDLAKHLRIPDVRWITQELKRMSGVAGCLDVFVRTVNVRPIWSEGSAVVTLVVDNYEMFKQLLQNPKNVEKIHYSDGTKLRQ